MPKILNHDTQSTFDMAGDWTVTVHATVAATEHVATFPAVVEVPAFIYALGLGTPLILTATFFSWLGSGSRVWQILRGRGISLNLGVTTLHLHTTSMASGLLLIGTGALLASGQLSALSRWAVRSPLTVWVLQFEDVLRRVFVGG